MTVQSAPATQDELLSEWHKKAWIKRLFLPGDFMEQVSMVREESMVCHKTTMDYLAMNDNVEERTVRLGEADKYSTDLDYRPQEFRNETLKLINDAQVIVCSSCSRRGHVTCGSCSGSGQVSCNTTQDCGSCGGSGTRSESCGGCGGSGKISHSTPGRYGPVTNYRNCSSCGGSGRRTSSCGSCSGGKVTCTRCGGRGIRTCDRCSGSGIVTCGTCGGTGVMVYAEFITRKFSRSKELTYQLSGLAADEFKNGLAAKHFKSVRGDLVSEEFQAPASSDIVLQRQTVHSYDVLSHCYSYNGAEFWLNQITSGSASKYVASGLPISKTRTSIAGAAFFVAALAVSALLIFL